MSRRKSFQGRQQHEEERHRGRRDLAWVRELQVPAGPAQGELHPVHLRELLRVVRQGDGLRNSRKVSVAGSEAS